MRGLVFGLGRAALMAPLAVLAACEQAAEKPETVEVPINRPANDAGGAPAQDSGATPMSERVALLGLLNKRNNVSEEIELKPGETREIGPVTIRLSACERTAPWEMPQEVGAFVQVDIREREGAAPARVFSGWLFRESPSLNVVEHPIYDVWVKDCKMAFPGDDAKPAPRPASTPAPAPSAATAAPAPTPAAEPAADPD
jgi:hypothetical protein